jgi:pimeloyl-ACP methyl ester carboxylesterase
MRLVDWTAADGTRIVARLHGNTNAARRIVCLPGLTRNSRDFEGLAGALTRDPECPRAILAVDFRGRGLSGRPGADSYRPDVEATDVLAGLDRLGWQRPAFVGTSRGGIVTMVLAATAPDRVGPVVLNDIGPVLSLGGLVAIRDRMGRARSNPPADWEAAIAGLRRSMGRAFTALGDVDFRRLAARLYRDVDGVPVADYDPALYDAFAGFDPAVGIPPFWPLFEALAPRPVLAIRGDTSDLLDEATLAEMAARHAGMQVHRVPGEGHAPLLDDAPTQARIAAFLDAAEPHPS